MAMKVQKKIQLTGHNAAIYDLFFDDIKQYVYSGDGNGWIVRWNLDQPDFGKLIAKVETNIFSMCSLLEQHRIVAGNMNGGVHWIDLNQPNETKNIAHHKKGVYAIARQDKYVFTAGGDGILTRWSIENAKSLESLQLTYSAIRSIAIHEKRNEMALGASDNNIYILDLSTFEIKKTIAQAHGNSVFTVCYSPNGIHLVSGGRDAHLKVWNIEQNYDCVLSEPAHWFTINDIIFHPKGHWMATASRDKTIKIWDASSYKLLKVLETFRNRGHLNSVNRLLWNEQFLLSCSDDRSIIGWEILT